MEWAERSMDTQTDRQTLRMMMMIIRRYIIDKKRWQSEPGRKGVSDSATAATEDTQDDIKTATNRGLPYVHR